VFELFLSINPNNKLIPSYFSNILLFGLFSFINDFITDLFY